MLKQELLRTAGMLTGSSLKTPMSEKEKQSLWKTIHFKSLHYDAGSAASVGQRLHQAAGEPSLRWKAAEKARDKQLKDGSAVLPGAQEPSHI